MSLGDAVRVSVARGSWREGLRCLRAEHALGGGGAAAPQDCRAATPQLRVSFAALTTVPSSQWALRAGLTGGFSRVAQSCSLLML